MKALFSSLFLSIGLFAFSQDTTELIKYNDGSKFFKLSTKKDTNYYQIYPNGKKESIRPVKKYQISGKYSRWYENGKLMWEKELLNGVQEGKSIFYNEKGQKMAELNYTKGNLVDTVYVKENSHLIFGKITYSSIVYGGMEREDGSSNVSEHSGPYMNCSLMAIEIDSLKPSKLIDDVKSDMNGDFFVSVPIGKIGFFQKGTDVKLLVPGEYYLPEKMWSSGNDSWNMTKPFRITEKDEVVFITLHHSSVGYAP